LVFQVIFGTPVAVSPATSRFLQERCPMFTLESGNVLLKRSHRRQLNAWLKRALRLGHRLAAFSLRLTMSRSGSHYAMQAAVQHAGGRFDCHVRAHDWSEAARQIIRLVTMQLHDQLTNAA